MEVTKTNGEIVEFKSNKLSYSLKKAGASEKLITEIVDHIKTSLFDKMTTKEIYMQAFKLLKQKDPPKAARYKLKKAIMELGETVYPFEKFVGELLKAEGFTVKVGVIVKGKCVTHEVDVIAEKDNLHFMCECKFHKWPKRHCDVKIPLYIQSRFKDVEAEWQKKVGHQIKFHQGWIFTNTRFTSDATQYAECSGLRLVSWDYPKANGIKDRIDKTGVHPITCLTTISHKETVKLIENDIVTCKKLCERPEVLADINIGPKRQNDIIREAKMVCTN